jgi:hypothetical protein
MDPAVHVFVHFANPTGRHVETELLDMIARGILSPGLAVPPPYHVIDSHISPVDPDSVDLTVANGGGPVDVGEISAFIRRYYSHVETVQQFDPPVLARAP